MQGWLRNAEPRALLITGNPGSGKTALAGHLFEISEHGNLDSQLGLGQGFLSAVHFCSSSDHRWIDPIAFTKSVSLQLAAAVPGFREALLEESNRELRASVEQHVSNSNNVVGLVIEELTVGGQLPQRAFTELVGGPLSRLLGDSREPAVLLLVDAVDESRTGRASDDIAALLAGIGELPPGVRLIASSRPDRQFERAMDRLGAQVISLSAGEDGKRRGDMERFVKTRLSPEQRERIDKGLGFETFVNLCVQRADGNLLYAHHLLAMLDQSRDGDLDEASLDTVPAGLDGIYIEYIERIGRIAQLDWDRLGSMLGALSVAFAAPTEEQLSGWLGISSEATRKGLAAIAPLLDDEPGPPTSRQVSLYHRSFADFLLDGERADEFWRPPAEQHKKIASSYCDRHRHRWEGCDAYGLAHLAKHLAAAEEPELLLATLDADFLKAKAEWAGSLRPVLDDLRLGLRAAVGLGQRDRALGMVLSQVLLKHRVRRLPDETLPLLAGAGEVDRALELIAMLDRSTDLRRQMERLVRYVLRHDPGRAATIAAAIVDAGASAYAELDVLVHEIGALAPGELSAACAALAHSLETALPSHYAAHALMRLARAAGKHDATVQASLLDRTETVLRGAEPTLMNGIALGSLARALAGDDPGRAGRLFQAAARGACSEGENETGAIRAGEYVAELGQLELPAAILLAGDLPTATGRAHASIRLIELADTPELRARFDEEARTAVRAITSIGKAEAGGWAARAKVWLAVELEGEDALPELVNHFDLDLGLRDVLSNKRHDPDRALALARMIRDTRQRDLALDSQVERHLDASGADATLAISDAVTERGLRCTLLAQAAAVLHRADPAAGEAVIERLETNLRGGDPSDLFACTDTLAQVAPESARRFFDAGLGAAEAGRAGPRAWEAAAKAALSLGDSERALSLLRRGLREGRASDECEWQAAARRAILRELAKRDPRQAFELRDSLGDTGGSVETTGAIAEGLADADPDRALALLEELSGDDSEGEALAAIVLAAADRGDPRTMQLMRRFLAWEGHSWLNLKGDVAARAARALCATDPASAAELVTIAAENRLSDVRLVARALRRLGETADAGTTDAVLDAIASSSEVPDARWLVPFSRALAGTEPDPETDPVSERELKVEQRALVAAARSVATSDPERSALLAQARQLADAVSPTWQKLDVLSFIVEVLVPSQPERARELGEEILEIASGMERPHEAVAPLCDAAVALASVAETQAEGSSLLEGAFAVLGATTGADASLTLEDSLDSLAELPLPMLEASLPAALEAAPAAADAVLRELGRLQGLLLKADGADKDPTDYLEEIEFAEAIAEATLVP